MTVVLPPLTVERTGPFVPDAWRPLIEPVCELKEALDHAVRWPDSTPARGRAAQVLALHGMTLQQAAALKTSHLPDRFARHVLGDWFAASGEPVGTWARTSLPHWCTLGWVRKDAYRVTPDRPQARLRALVDELHADDGAMDATAHGLSGIPIFWAGEGKNRCQLYRLAGRARVGRVTLYPAPDLSAWCLAPVLGARHMVALIAPDGRVQLLPFGRASKPLLSALGVRWRSRPVIRPWVESLQRGQPMPHAQAEYRLRAAVLAPAA
ncbi:hypothetical protein [uncultured Pseudacidovorax sp.]|uniref:hypothetical protein n=1 Tax=uncultured Pseudacidovorax sp. TaxID=679313 RepID=UPI0025DAC27D|nr:hypothetical protein [uncultured Pseudacidovorax sp.]